MDEKKLQQEFIQFLSAKLQAKDEQDLRDKVKNLSQDDMEKYYEEFSKKKLKKAAHGSKLQYFRQLKHQCAEDEELVYFKKGGSVGCGCVKKKMEDGGRTPNKKKFAVNSSKQDQATKDSIAANVYNDEEIQDTRPGFYKKNKNGKVQWTPDRTKAPYKKENGGGLKKNCGGATIKLKKKGGEVCPKCGKIHAAGTGCAAKFKKHLQGGSLMESILSKSNKISLKNYTPNI